METNRLLLKELSQIPDGSWIETDSKLTTILRTWPWEDPKPEGAIHVWRKKQLEDQLEWTEYQEQLAEVRKRADLRR